MFIFTFIDYSSSFSSASWTGTVLVDVRLSSFFVIFGGIILVARLLVLAVRAGVRILSMLRDIFIRPAVVVAFGSGGVLGSLIPGKSGVDGGGDCIG